MFARLVRNLILLTGLTLIFAYMLLSVVTTCPDGIKTVTQQHVECN